MFDRPLVQIMQQPDLILNNVDDLMRYKDGDLVGFLLKLSPEQESYASWSLKVKGPTLVKGNPGTVIISSSSRYSLHARCRRCSIV